MSTKPSEPPSERCPSGPTLFDVSLGDRDEATTSAETRIVVTGQARVQRANRQQIVFRPLALDELLPEDHEARVVWNYVEGLDLGPLYQPILAVEGEVGRPATDPKILLALWLYATLQGVGSARQLHRFCQEHVAYQWICGDVPMNYHTLSDFRTAHGEFLDDLLTKSVATLMEQDLVQLQRVAQDGMRVRANAGAASFRRRKSLEACLTEAEEQVSVLREELDADPAQTTRRHQAARQRAARQCRERVKKALEQLPELEAKKKAGQQDQARASTTDPEARVMKMGDGGFRPAYNVQFCTDTATQVIVGVEVVNCGSDQGQLAPMIEQVQQRYEQVPDEVLVDGGFAKKEDIEKVSAPAVGTVVYAPVQTPKDPQRDPHTPREGDSATVAAWRIRMGTPEAKAIYKERAATAECVNAIARNRGMRQFQVRGLAKVRVIALWYAVAHNLMRAVALRAAAAAVGA